MPKRDWPRCEDESGCSSAVRRDVPTGKGPAVDLRCERHKIDDTLRHPEPEAEVYTPEEDVPAEIEDDSSEGSERITSLRAALQEGLITSEVADLVRDRILEALRASREVKGYCSKCREKVYIVLPDLATRMNAATNLLSELEGKLQSAAEVKLTAEQRRVEARQEALAKALDVDLDSEIKTLAAQLGVDPDSPLDPKLDGFTSKELSLFIERHSGGEE